MKPPSNTVWKREKVGGVEIQWKGWTCSKYIECIYEIITMKPPGSINVF
jgi:hypothetical protein